MATNNPQGDAAAPYDYFQGWFGRSHHYQRDDS